MTFDSNSGVTVMTVGISTYEWDGVDWTQVATTGQPARSFAAMAFDSARNVAVLFGGESLGSRRNDTWEWDGTGWTQRNPAQTPPPRMRHAMAYDEARQRIVLFGGQDGSTSYQDTWEWDGTNWSECFPVTTPPGRYEHSLSYDASRGVVVMFGGRAFFTANDTWEWDGFNWFERFPATRPAERRGHRMVFDRVRNRSIMFGGWQGGSEFFADTWAWDGSDWLLLAPAASPARRFHHAMAYDSARNVAVLFGGDNGGVADLRDTWEYHSGTPGSFTNFGTGCVGTRGAPFLTLRSGLPTAGQQISVQLNNLPLSGVAFMFMGLSNTNYGSLTLPFDLSVIGMQGCLLHVSGDLLFGVQNVLGVGMWSIRVPTALAGQRFYVQGIVADPGANQLGLTVSDAGEAFVGQ